MKWFTLYRQGNFFYETSKVIRCIKNNGWFLFNVIFKIQCNFLFYQVVLEIGVTKWF